MQYTLPTVISPSTLITLFRMVLRSAAALVTEGIVCEINEAGVFSLQADETKDLAKVEQLLLYLRYVKDGQIKDRFIKFTACSDLTALSLCDTILNTLRDNAVSIDQKCCTCYDDAAVKTKLICV